MDTESPLYRAKLKLQDAATVGSSDPTIVYHMGRVCLLLGERETARQYLTAALALRPTLSPARLCLGLVMGPEHSKYAAKLLLHGLSQWLLRVQEGRETLAELEREPAKELHGSNFYRTSNTLVVRGKVVWVVVVRRIGYETEHVKNTLCIISVHRWKPFYACLSWVGVASSQKTPPSYA